jgi:hypothetical protein
LLGKQHGLEAVEIADDGRAKLIFTTPLETAVHSKLKTEGGKFKKIGLKYLIYYPPKDSISLRILQVEVGYRLILPG